MGLFSTRMIVSSLATLIASQTTGVSALLFLQKKAEIKGLLRDEFLSKYGEAGIEDRLDEALRALKDTAKGCPDKDATFNADKLTCDIDSNGWDSVCRCKEEGKTLTATKPCDVNHCGGAYSTSCLGVKDQKTAWINEFLSNAFIPLFNGCCDTHDEGYCVPGGSKLAIDKKFQTCMHSVCDSKDETKVRTEEKCKDKKQCSGRGRKRSCSTTRECKTVKKNERANKWCHIRADIAYTAVERGGLKSFNAKMDSMMECQ